MGRTVKSTTVSTRVVAWGDARVPETLLVLIRSIIAFIWLFFLTRFVGRKQVSQLTFTEYVVGITIGSIAAQASTDPQNRFLDGIVGVAVWAVAALVLTYLQQNSNAARKFIEGEPVVLVARGQVQEKGLHMARLSVSEFMELLRQQNIFDLRQVDWALMETDGQLTVLKKPEYEPLTAKTAGVLTPSRPEFPYVVIADGQVLPNSLRAAGKDEAWLRQELLRNGVDDPSQVMVGQVAGNQLYVDLKQDTQQTTQPPTRATLGNDLESLQTDFATWALETEDPEARQMYEDYARRTGEILKELDALVR